MKTFDPNKPVQTRDGKPARIIFQDAFGDYPIVALVPLADGNEHPENYTKEGRLTPLGADSPRDLVNVPRKVEVELVLHAYEGAPNCFTLAEPGVTFPGHKLIARKTVKVTVEEGEGL